jgi:hypothetical protein
MSPDITYAILFGGLALLAQYLPARLGIPIGLAAVALSIWQLGWVGWPLGLAIILTVLVMWRVLINRGIFQKDIEKEKGKNIKKEQARKLHSTIMELLSQLEVSENKLSENENWQQNQQIRNILDDLQKGLNNLGYLVNNYDYDRWVEYMMHTYSSQIHFHMKEHDSDYSEWGRARINAKFRYFINKIKG